MQLNKDEDPSFYFNGYDKERGLIALGIIFIFFVIILGEMKGIKALIALIATIILIIAGAIAYLFSMLTRITGFSSDDAQILQYLPGGIAFDF